MRRTFVAGWLAGFGAALLGVALLVFGPPNFLNGADRLETAPGTEPPAAGSEGVPGGVIASRSSPPRR